MSDNVVIRVDEVHKKFCRNLHKSLWYGVHDIAYEILGRSNRDKLRNREFWALRGISFELKQGECLGIVGRNGAGKSTLLKLLNGIIKPDGGRIEVNGRVGALIELGMGFIPILTGRENIYNNAAILGISNKEVKKKFDDIVGFAELDEFIDMPIQNYSSGMKVRLGFAIAAQLECEILLIDEVLAVGDTAFKDKCFRKIAELKEQGVSLILISHNPYHIFQACERAIYLSRGIVKKIGKVESVMNAYDYDLPLALENHQKTEKDKYPGNIIITKCGFIKDVDIFMDEVEMGEAYKFIIQCMSNISADDINVTIVVRDLKKVDGLRLVLSSHLDGKLLNVNYGMNNLEIVFPQLLLAPSMYTVNVKIRRGPMSVEYCEPDYRFKVISTMNYEQSLFHQPREWHCKTV